MWSGEWEQMHVCALFSSIFPHSPDPSNPFISSSHYSRYSCSHTPTLLSTFLLLFTNLLLLRLSCSSFSPVVPAACLLAAVDTLLRLPLHQPIFPFFPGENTFIRCYGRHACCFCCCCGRGLVQYVFSREKIPTFSSGDMACRWSNSYTYVFTLSPTSSSPCIGAGSADY